MSTKSHAEQLGTSPAASRGTFSGGLAKRRDGQDPALSAEISPMSDDLFQRTQAMFDLPKGVVYLDGNSLGAMPKSARERVRRELDESWGRELIRAWNSAGWIDLPLASAIASAPSSAPLRVRGRGRFDLDKPVQGANRRSRTRCASQGHPFRQRQFPDRSLRRRGCLSPARAGS